MRNVLLACLVFAGWSSATAEPRSCPAHKPVPSPSVSKPAWPQPAQPLKTIVHRLEHADAKQVALEINSVVCGKHQIERTVNGSVVESKLVIVPDSITNSLIVVATLELAEEVRRLVEKADRRPKQYVVEATISEIGPDGKQTVRMTPTLMTLAGQSASISMQHADGQTFSLQLTVDERTAQEQPQALTVPISAAPVQPGKAYPSTTVPHSDTPRKTQPAAKIRGEQEFAALVDKFNKCINRRDYTEAERLAERAIQLDPKNPVAVTMKFKARLARRVRESEQLKRQREREQARWTCGTIDSHCIVAIEEAIPQKSAFAQCGSETGESEEELRIEKSLSKPVSLDFKDTPLNEVIHHLATAADVNVVLDSLGLQEVGAQPTTKVTLKVGGVKLKSVLNLLLEPLELTYMIDDEVLKITSRQRSQGDLFVANYPVADLVTATEADDPSRRINSLDSLRELIATTVRPDSWDELGGNGSVKPYEGTLSLVVRQTPQVHDEIRDLLAMFRRLLEIRGEKEKEEFLLGIEPSSAR